MSDAVIRSTYANSGSRAYDRVIPDGEGVRYSVALPSGARFTMLKAGNAEGCEITLRNLGKLKGKQSE
jgi:hypothetical protein